MQRKDYEAQVTLVVQTLPFVAMEKVLALKGGTAINLFFRDFPRISVDIDLTYLSIKGQNESLTEINDTLDRISSAVETALRGPFESDARHGPHLPDLGTPAVPSAQLDRLRPTRAKENSKCSAKKRAQTRKYKWLPEKWRR